MIHVIETSLNETERYIIRMLGEYGPGIGLQLPEGHMADTAADLVRRGFVEEICGYYALTDAGRSQQRPNR